VHVIIDDQQHREGADPVQGGDCALRQVVSETGVVVHSKTSRIKHAAADAYAAETLLLLQHGENRLAEGRFDEGLDTRKNPHKHAIEERDLRLGLFGLF
jgi:hypothetical protein